MREGGRELRSPEATIRLDSKAGLCGKGDSCSIVVPSRFSFYKFCWHVNYWLVVLIVVLNSHWCWTFATLLPSSVFPSLWLSSLLQVSKHLYHVTQLMYHSNEGFSLALLLKFCGISNSGLDCLAGWGLGIHSRRYRELRRVHLEAHKARLMYSYFWCEVWIFICSWLLVVLCCVCCVCCVCCGCDCHEPCVVVGEGESSWYTGWTITIRYCQSVYHERTRISTKVCDGLCGVPWSRNWKI
jgi:hypothetical protein